MDLPGLMAAIEEFLDDQLDGESALHVTLHLKNGDDFKIRFFSPKRQRRESPEPIEEERPARVQRSAPRIVVEHPRESEDDVFEPGDDTEADRAKSRCPLDIMAALDEAKGPQTLSRLLASMMKNGHEWSHRHVQAWLQSLMREGTVVHIKDGKRRGYCLPEWAEEADEA